jgi:hypothetical protein
MHDARCSYEMKLELVMTRAARSTRGSSKTALDQLRTVTITRSVKDFRFEAMHDNDDAPRGLISVFRPLAEARQASSHRPDLCWPLAAVSFGSVVSRLYLVLGGARQ